MITQVVEIVKLNIKKKLVKIIQLNRNKLVEIIELYNNSLGAAGVYRESVMTGC